MSPSPESFAGSAPARRPLAIAHRGWHKVHAENTLEAFRAAYEAGCDMVEFDVQLSRDGVPFVFHDDDGARLAGRKERVCDLDWKALKDWALAPKAGGAEGGYRLPTLEEFLAEFGSRAFYLEMKVPRVKHGDRAYYETLAQACAELVKESRPHPDTFLASFHGPVLEHLARAGAFPRLVCIHEALEKFRETLVTGRPPVERHSLSWRLWRGYLKSAAPALGQKVEPDRVLVWDLRARADMESAKEAGVHALVADDVETLVEVCRG